jgi:hypothetical protein
MILHHVWRMYGELTPLARSSRLDHIVLSLVAFIMMGLSPGHACNGVAPGQVQALMELYNSTNGTGWDDNHNWGMGNPCNNSAPWSGVLCAGNSTIV